MAIAGSRNLPAASNSTRPTGEHVMIAAIGLAIVVIYFRNRGSIEVEDVNMMKG